MVLRRLARRRLRRRPARDVGAGVGAGAGAITDGAADGAGVRDEQGIAFDRQMFLLTKQLAYFERYGKLYLGDLPLLHDPEVFRAFL